MYQEPRYNGSDKTDTVIAEGSRRVGRSSRSWFGHSFGLLSSREQVPSQEAGCLKHLR